VWFTRGDAGRLNPSIEEISVKSLQQRKPGTWNLELGTGGRERKLALARAEPSESESILPRKGKATFPVILKDDGSL